MKFYKTLSAVVLIRGVAAGSVPMMSPIPKPPFKNETKHSTAETLVTTITSDYSFYCPEPTTFHHKNLTYTATEPTYLSITKHKVTCHSRLSHGPPGQPMIPTPPVMSSSAPAPPLPPSKPAPPPTKATVPYSEPSPPKATVPAAGTLPPPPPPEVSVSAPGSPPPPSIPGQPAVPPSRAAPPPVNPTGTIEASVPSAAANKVSGSFGAFVLAGIAALAM
ncbi:Cell wall SED1 [Fusarium agapanthi]|uniref:Cell wall SED1 n=1 Tax=Fusarium agapanthi TaxID=1803897 RepID=A0A9P5BBD7_9HYPO|nr:Cell wall SED1 [Fusarium agapanthi]